MTATSSNPPQQFLVSSWQVAVKCHHDEHWVAIHSFAARNKLLWHHEHDRTTKGIRWIHFSTMNFAAVDYADGSALGVGWVRLGDLGIHHDHCRTHLLHFLNQLNAQFPISKGEHWNIPLRQHSGDANLDVMVVAQRLEALKKDTLIKRIRSLWRILPKDHRGYLVQEVHHRVFSRIFLVLSLDVYDGTVQEQLVHADWNLRSLGRPAVDVDRFIVTMVVTADAWCETNDVVEYSQFVESISRLAVDALRDAKVTSSILTSSHSYNNSGQHTTNLTEVHRSEARNVILGSLGRKNIKLSSPQSPQKVLPLLDITSI